MAPSHYLNQCWNIVNWTLRNKLLWNFNRNSNIFIQQNALENVVCEMASILSGPQLRRRCCCLRREVPPAIGGLRHKGPEMRSFDVFFGISLNKPLNKQSNCRWIQTSCHSCNVIVLANLLHQRVKNPEYWTWNACESNIIFQNIWQNIIDGLRRCVMCIPHLISINLYYQ